MTTLSASLTQRLTERLREAREKYPAALSDDGQALLVDGGIGYGAYISPHGDIFMETYGLIGDTEHTVDRSAHAQTMAVVLGARRIPELAELIPARPNDAQTCGDCSGEGWRRWGPNFTFICERCAGLGWLKPEHHSVNGQP
jgi:hypothetical protein